MGRFLRTQRLIGSDNLEILAQSTVFIAGLGAVGSYAAEGIARLGTGSIILTDFDRVSESNINRQLYALDSTIGKKKTDVAHDRIRDINPECSLVRNDTFINGETIPSLLETRPDIVIDAIDSLNSKVELLAYCYHSGIPVVSSMGAALKRDPSKIHTGDIFSTSGCSLAKAVRKRLKRREVGEGIQCVYSSEITEFDFIDPESDPDADEIPVSGRPRRVLGSLPTIPGIFGLILANLALEHLLDQNRFS